MPRFVETVHSAWRVLEGQARRGIGISKASKANNCEIKPWCTGSLEVNDGSDKPW